MQWVTVSNFSAQGSYSIPNAGEFVAVGIAAASEVDVCLIAGQMLGPRALVPFAANVQAVRGVRTGLLPAGGSADTIGQKLVLQLYERCDPLVAPGPRSAISVSSDFYTVPAALGATDPILRVPFSGRTQCEFALKRSAGTEGTDLGYLVRGVRYNTHAFQQINRGILTNGAQQRCVFAETTTGTIGTTVSTADGVSPLNRVFYVGGGGDLQEGFDELELYVFGAAGFAHAQAEATGERG